MLLRMFLRQALFECECIVLAHNEIVAAKHANDLRKLFFNIQNFLGAAANASKTFWGQAQKNGRRIERARKPVRDAIGLTDRSPLRIVKMRNNFEHFDERIDEWWIKSQRHNFIDFILGHPSNIVGGDNIDIFRLFNDTTGILYFWGQEFDIKAILNEAIRIIPTLREESEKLHEVVGLKPPQA